MKKHLSTVILILVFIVGLSLLLYPAISDYWNSLHQSRAIAGYVEEVRNLDEERYAQIRAAAENYNQQLALKGNTFVLDEQTREDYNRQLNISGSGIMGYIDIPQINCYMPIYHSTQDAVLQIGAGHIEGTSLPIGGENTHSVLSGHRGLPSAKLFTDLDKMKVGDTFTFNVLNETLTYQVYEILTVLPHEVDSLKIEKGRDLCTLVTCTPYGVNTHRLLVKGERVENAAQQQTVRVTSDAQKIEPVIVASILAVPMLLILLVILLAQPRKKKGETK